MQTYMCPKVFLGLLRLAQEADDGSGKPLWTLGNIPFQRVIIQGIVVDVLKNGKVWLLDDGSGIIKVNVQEALASMQSEAKPGHASIVMVVCQMIRVHPDMAGKAVKIFDLSSNCERETLWNLEVVDVTRAVYNKFL
eukprot:jgi/Mesvir1/29237/Mv11418-RA.1